jgi:DNA recombination-mediator protein A
MFQARVTRQLVRAHENQAIIVTYAHPRYPKNVWASNNPVPILYVKGSLEVLGERAAVACVGSRNTAGECVARHASFATLAVRLRRFDLVLCPYYGISAETAHFGQRRTFRQLCRIGRDRGVSAGTLQGPSGEGRVFVGGARGLECRL